MDDRKKLDSLPDDVKLEQMKYLDDKSLVRLASVSRSYRILVNEEIKERAYKRYLDLVNKNYTVISVENTSNGPRTVIAELLIGESSSDNLDKILTTLIIEHKGIPPMELRPYELVKYERFKDDILNQIPSKLYLYGLVDKIFSSLPLHPKRVIYL